MNYRNSRYMISSKQLNRIMDLCEIYDFKSARDVVNEVLEDQLLYGISIGGNVKKEAGLLKKMFLKGGPRS